MVSDSPRALPRRRSTHDRQGQPADHGLRQAGGRRPELRHRRPARPGPDAGRAPAREARALRPRAHPRARRARQGRRRVRLLRGDRRRHEVHARRLPQRGRQEDRRLRPLQHRRRREGVGRHRARPPRLRHQVLHGRGQLRHDGQQHARLLHPRPAQVHRLHPHAEAEPADQPEGPGHVLGLPLAHARVGPPGDDPLLRPRHARRLPPHERLLQPQLRVVQRGGRAVLRAVPLQDGAGHRGT